MFVPSRKNVCPAEDTGKMCRQATMHERTPGEEVRRILDKGKEQDYVRRTVNPNVTVLYRSLLVIVTIQSLSHVQLFVTP